MTDFGTEVYVFRFYIPVPTLGFISAKLSKIMTISHFFACSNMQTIDYYGKHGAAPGLIGLS